jgi:hypothetical protein
LEDPFAIVEPERRRAGLRGKRLAGARGDQRIPLKHSPAHVDFVTPRNQSSPYLFKPDFLLASQAFIPKWPTVSGMDESEATDICARKLFGSAVALTCSEYLGNLLATAFDFCKADLQVKHCLIITRFDYNTDF